MHIGSKKQKSDLAPILPAVGRPILFLCCILTNGVPILRAPVKQKSDRSPVFPVLRSLDSVCVTSSLMERGYSVSRLSNHHDLAPKSPELDELAEAMASFYSRCRCAAPWSGQFVWCVPQWSGAIAGRLSIEKAEERLRPVPPGLGRSIWFARHILTNGVQLLPCRLSNTNHLAPCRLHSSNWP